MRKLNFSIIAISSMLMVSCGGDISSSQASLPTSSTTPTSSTINSDQTSIENSSTSDNSVTADVLKEELKNAIDAANKKDALEVMSTDFIMDMSSTFSKSITYFTADGALDTTMGDEGVTNDSGSFTAVIDNATISEAAKNLQGENKTDLLTSIKLITDMDVSYKGFESTRAKNYNGEKVSFAAYLEEGSVYVDFDDETLRSVLLDTLNNFLDMELNSTVLPKYFKLDNALSTTSPWPLSVITSQMIDDDLKVIFDEYDNLPQAAKNAVQFTKDDDYHINIKINKMVLATMPLLYQTIAEEKLDPTSETYQSDKDDIAATVTQMNKIISKTTINTLTFDFAFNASGYSYLDFDIDVIVKNYSVSIDTTTNEDGTSSEEEIVLDEFALKTSGIANFLYNDDVTVLKHSNSNTYITIDIEALMESFNKEE